MSLRTKLLVLVVGLLALVLGGLGLYLGPAVSEWSAQALDGELRRRADVLEAALEVERSGDVRLEDDEHERRELRSSPMRVESFAGTALLETPFDWPTLPRLTEGETTVSVRAPSGTQLRVLSRVVVPEHAERLDGGGRLVLRVAAPAGAFAALGERFRTGLLVALVAALLAGALGALLIAQVSLAPLRRLSSEVAGIEERSLGKRLSTARLDPDLTRLAVAFNGVLERVERALERQKQFVARASHSLRTPTASILSQAEVTLRRERTPEEYRQALATIAEAARESASIAERILATSRADASAADLRREALSARALCDDVARLFAARVEQAGLALELAPEPGADLFADGARVHELVDALLDNAVRYTPRDGKVGLRIARAGDDAELEVWDTGLGISAEERAQVFERFYRGRAASESGAPGSGLGLAIARSIAEAHGGSIELFDRPGGGTRVIVRLPARPRPET